jgi:hypothetical protein
MDIERLIVRRAQGWDVKFNSLEQVGILLSILRVLGLWSSSYTQCSLPVITELGDKVGTERQRQSSTFPSDYASMSEEDKVIR